MKETLEMRCEEILLLCNHPDTHKIDSNFQKWLTGRLLAIHRQATREYRRVAFTKDKAGIIVYEIVPFKYGPPEA